MWVCLASTYKCNITGQPFELLLFLKSEDEDLRQEIEILQILLNGWRESMQRLTVHFSRYL